MSIVKNLIEQNYTLVGAEGQRYLRTLEHNSLVIDTDRDLFFWNSKGIAGDAFVWLTEIEGKSYGQAKRIVNDLQGRYGLQQVYTQVVNTKGEEVVVYPRLVEIFWENGKNEREYWYKRGMLDSTIDRFQLGYFNGWSAIPFFWNGSFLNFQMRRDIPDKRIMPWYRGVGALLFNADILKITNDIVITESPVDAILLSQYNIPAISHGGGAEYWSKAWFKYFIHQKRITILYDNDEAGKKGAIKVAKALGEYRCFVWNFEDKKEKYDVGDYVKETPNIEEDFNWVLRKKAKRIFES